jgi:hypothetical protein
MDAAIMTELEPLDRIAEAIEALRLSSAPNPKSDAFLFAPQEIVRAILQALREPSFAMIFAGLDRLKMATRTNVSGPALEKAWVAMIDVLLIELPAHLALPPEPERRADDRPHDVARPKLIPVT